MKDRNLITYIVTIVIIIIVYYVIYLFGAKIGDDGYEYNPAKQPTNNIISGVQNNNGQNGSKNSLSIVFKYESEQENYIDLYNQFPTTDEVGKAFSGDKYTHDFKLKLNPLASGVYYVITLKKQVETDMPDDWAKVYLEANGIGVRNCFRENGRVKTYNEYQSYFGDDEEKILYEGIVTYAEALKGYKDFTLRMWMSEDVKFVNENLSGKSFKAKVTVYAVE